jgi:prepilin-type N-terminal cleavage/methylation domain-containing protein
MRRRSFSLLEIMVSISIASILFGVLFYKIRDFVFLRKEITSVEMECLERHALQIRLEELFSRLITTETEGEFSSPFYYKDHKIHFQVVREFDIDPSFVDKLHYTLWLDPQTNVLTLLCKNPAGAVRKEMLASGILSCSFRFYSEKEIRWQDQWPQNSKQSPTFVQLVCKKKNSSIEYLIPVHSQI